MIKRIAFTASIMLFVLAQIFSFYVISISHQEKIELLKEKEGKFFSSAVHHFLEDMRKTEHKTSRNDNVQVFYFRKNMPEGCALYQGEKELYSSSPYEFAAKNVIWEDAGYPCNVKAENINGRHLLVFYAKYDRRNYSYEWAEDENYYIIFHVLDITSVYSENFYLIIRELAVSILASGGMALLLIYLIKKITKPLQAVNETQRQLIGSMSHELKTPLTVIKGYSETLLSVRLSKEQQEMALNYINQESGRLSRLSEKMMELTRLYKPEYKITLEKIKVEDLFEIVENSVDYSLKQKEIILEREGDYQGIVKEMDMDLMTSFLINLINNSAMASKEGSRIYMGADESSLWVRDEGCGIPSGEVDKVKKAFYRVDKSRSRKSGNMGLGLALCEQIAAVHRGEMHIESTVGEGTKVSFTKH